MVDYTWAFVQAEVLPESQGLNNVVNVVHWVLNAEDEDGVTASCYGSVGLGAPEAGNFVPFVDLEKAQVEGWVEAAINAQKRPRDTSPLSIVEQLKANLAKEITDKKVPESVQMEFNF